MPNFGEEVACLYLRLNGFFMVHDFVMHANDELAHTTDVDVLAIRPPYVYEPTGGSDQDWDLATFLRWGIDLRTRMVGLIVEVKTGRVDLGTVQQKFSRERLTYAVSRLGLLSAEHVAVAVEQLSDQNTSIHIGDVTLAKLLISEQIRDNWPCMTISLESALAFIRRRAREYKEVKRRDRTYFPSILFEYFAAGYEE